MRRERKPVAHGADLIGYVPGVKWPAVITAAVYLALIVYPTYLAGTAPGEPITFHRVMTYAAGVAVSVGLGLLRLPEWRYVLPWVVAGALTMIAIALPVVGDLELFPSAEFFYPVWTLAAAEACAIWIGYRARFRRAAPSGA